MSRPGEDESPLPTVAALEALWRETSQARWLGAPSLWRYLGLRYRVRLAMINPYRLRVVAPAGKVNDCDSCTDICCVGPHSTVLLRLRDIATLIDIERTDLITGEGPTFSDEELAKRPAVRRNLGSQGWQIFPKLKQDRMSACAALTLEGRCGIYPHWPLACQRFPYALHADTREVFYSQRCDSYWIRPDAKARVHEMVKAAATSYNERIKDLVLFEFARDRLAELGLLRFLDQP